MAPIRDGFSCSYGRFCAEPGRVERVEASTLRSMFLPKLSPEGKKQLASSSGDNFVRGQLKHYGVSFREDEISGNGTLLLKKVLRAGKCDQVPKHIAELQEQMHREWLHSLTLEELSSHPEWVMERYFLTSGKPDRTKTTAVVGIPLDPDSSYRAGQMRDAAKKIKGLHQETGYGPKTQTIFMGWDSAAVSKAAKAHVKDEAKEAQAEEDERENERAEMHADYLRTLKRKGSKIYSPVGHYIVDCKEIEEQWPDQAEDLNLDIWQTKEPGIFEVSFDFGILEGIMIISTEKKALEQYCSQLDFEDEANSDNDEERWEERYDDEEDEDDKKSSKRKAKAPQGRGRPPKKAKATASQKRTYVLKLKCRETGEGEIQYLAEDGTIQFKDENFASFTGKAGLPCVGEGIPFSARKVADAPSPPRKAWADYSERNHEYARVNRWR